MDQFVRLAVCNNLDLNVIIIKDDTSLDDFRKTVMTICACDNKILTCCYSRRVLGQRGHGHFTPIGITLYLFLVLMQTYHCFVNIHSIHSKS